MRLSILDDGHRLRARLFLRATSRDAPDIVRTLLYRPGFFARPLLAHTVPVMRGESFWTAAEREHLAGAIAARHECPFCAVTHEEMTTLAGGLSSPRPELVAAKEFLSALPDVATVPDGLPEAAARDAVRVALVWEVVNRLANAFGFQLRGDQLHSGTRALHKFGYRFPGFLLAGGPPATGDAVADLRHAVFEAPAVTDPATRQSVAREGEAGPWTAYAAQVRDASYRITDDDVAGLAAAHGEDAVYEVTVAAAVGAALRTYDAGCQAVRPR